MRAIRYERFGEAPRIVDVEPSACPPRGAVVRVQATGVCRSDWHAWQGHDDSVALPHIPGHEFAGVVEEVAPGVAGFRPGDRVTAPFILACGRCEQCRDGATQVCANQRQPGFTLPGSFAERVVVVEADLNLVRLPDGIDAVDAAGLGCRFGTAYHAVRMRGRVAADEWVAVFGCGGVGLSAVLVARAAGARVVAVDVDAAALEAARALGATAVEGGAGSVESIRELTGGGAHLTIDAVGSPATCVAAVEALRPRGRHVQVGLLLGAESQPPIPMDRVVALELELLGSHGIAVGEYGPMLAEIADGTLRPGLAVGTRIGFDELPDALAGTLRGGPGMTVAVLEG